jgi:hypothetical protein
MLGASGIWYGLEERQPNQHRQWTESQRIHLGFCSQRMGSCAHTGQVFSYKKGIWSKTGLVVEKARSVNEPVLAQAIQLMLKIENLRQTDMQAYIDKGYALCPAHQDQLMSIQEARKEIEKIRKTPSS